ncbi:hypothetical protein JCM21900_005848 [Sporobolomyces salmonicolor]
MQQVIGGLWIGDYQASQDGSLLEENSISCVVSAMRQEYSAQPGIALHRVAVDDTSTTNIIEHFVPCAEFIGSALSKGQNVLVHCQAGVSRSTTLVAAYLMLKLKLNVEQAVDKIRSVRPQVEPTQFFMLQLELFERCNCEWDPVKWPEERRFLMSFAQAQIMGGASPSIVLAYYPSPSASPRDRSDSFGLSMTPLSSEQISPPVSPLKPSTSSFSLSKENLQPRANPLPELAAPPARKRLTPRKADTEPKAQKEPEKAPVEKIGTKEQVVVQGRRIRCKMCRRELAAREHIVAHKPGMGQQAFAPGRRDMAAYRAELEKRRLDEIAKESQAPPSSAPALTAPSAVQPPTNPLAALRISKPLPGLRVAVPRPQPMAKPTPPPPSQPATTPGPTPSGAPETADSPAVPSATPTPPSSESAPPPPIPAIPATASELAPPPVVADDPPLLPSHVCSSYFVEPLSWMSPTLETGVLAGKIVCPNEKCGAKLGNFDWAGNQCSCGAWVCPGFALSVSRVDEISH